jgi:RNA polymerase sigma-70 factor (ECF subfamily)
MDLITTIELCLQNNRSAQRTLYESYKDNLYTIVYRLTKDFNQANDLLQETFIEAFKNLNKLKEPAYFHSWIKQILIRKTYKYMRQRIDNVDIDTVHLGQSETVDVGYIEKAVQSLPVKSRTVFVMYEIEGFSHNEIADTMDISVGTSKSQLNYAKTKLKQQLQPYLAE